MILKKMFSCLGVVAGLALASYTIAQDDGSLPPLRIEPASANLLATQAMDIAVYLPPEIFFPLNRPEFEPIYPSPYPSPALAPQRGPSILKIRASVNGQDVSAWFHECIQQHWTTIMPERVLLCKSLDYSPFVEGDNELTISIQQYDNPPYIGVANYRIAKSQRKFNDVYEFYEPKRFVVRGASFNTASNINVVTNQRVMIRAAGRVNVWPAKTSYVVSPKGAEVCGGLCLLPGANLGALLVKIGPYGRWFPVGEAYAYTADRPGELIFAINDKTTPADINDNLGSYEVSVGRY